MEGRAAAGSGGCQSAPSPASAGHEGSAEEVVRVRWVWVRVVSLLMLVLGQCAAQGVRRGGVLRQIRGVMSNQFFYPYQVQHTEKTK